MAALLFLALALVSAGAWSFLFLRRDKFEPEPRWLLFRLFVGGAVAAFVAGIFNTIAEESGVSTGEVTIFVAPPVEESAKLAALFLLAYGSRHFTQRVDGAVYGVSCGFGFAVVENFFYALDFGAFVLALRSLLLPIGHPLFTGVSGYFLAKRRLEGRALAVLVGLTLAVVLHMAWNAPVGLMELSSEWYGLLFLAVLPAEIFALTRFLKRMSGPDAQAIRRLIGSGPRQQPQAP